MDLGKQDKFGLEKRNGDPMKYHPSSGGLPADWQLGNPPIGLAQMPSSHCSSVSMADSFLPTIWSHPVTTHNLSFSENNVHQNSSGNSQNVTIGNPAAGPSRVDMGWNMPDPLLKGAFAPGILPSSLAHFPADSAFIERAARFSCFNSGSFGGIANPFGGSGPSSPYSNAPGGVPGAQMQRPELNADVSMPIDHSSNSGSPMKSQRDVGTSHGVGASSNDSVEHEISGGGREEVANLASAAGESASKGVNAKKRKKNNNQDMELDQVQGAPASSPTEATKGGVDTKQKGEHNSSTMATGKPTGKNVKDGSDAPKEDYIHVRARRGQATNSHSLAERVRREKISERMKFLQDLVPGCSKVTGKAVMLDEIINYVQSLQRQVEFLSMKLAAVNPRLDFNTEGILAKDLLQPRGGPSSTIGFSPDIVHSQFHQPHHGLVQSGIPGISNPSDALRRTINAQLTVMSGFKEPTPQMPTAWDEELHNIVQMSYGANPPLGAHDLNGKPHDGFSL